MPRRRAYPRRGFSPRHPGKKIACRSCRIHQESRPVRTSPRRPSPPEGSGSGSGTRPRFLAASVRAEERRLIRRNLVLRRGSQLRQAVRQLPKCPPVGSHRFGQLLQGGNRSFFLGGQILRGPLLGKLRNIQKHQPQREQPPSAIFANQSKFRLLAVNHVHRNERPDSRELRASPKRNSTVCFGSLAAQNEMSLCVGRRQGLAGAIGERESFQQCCPLLGRKSAKRRSVFRRKIGCELRLVRAAGRTERCGERRTGI